MRKGFPPGRSVLSSGALGSQEDSWRWQATAHTGRAVLWHKSPSESRPILQGTGAGAVEERQDGSGRVGTHLSFSCAVPSSKLHVDFSVSIFTP